MTYAVRTEDLGKRFGAAEALADLNLLAYALIQANRSGDAAEVFPAVSGVVTPWPWGLDGDPVQQFAYWQDRVRH